MIGADNLPGTARLTFDHSVATEAGFDGATVEVAVDGGAFTPVPKAAYFYNAPAGNLAGGSDNPRAGQPAFTGADGGSLTSHWGKSYVDLTAMGVTNGSTVQVRFVVSRDACAGLQGWWVDNVVVSTCRTITDANLTAAHAPEPSRYGQPHAIDVSVTGAAEPGAGTVTVKEGSDVVAHGGPVRRGRCGDAAPDDEHRPASATVGFPGDVNYNATSTTVDVNVTKGIVALTAVHQPQPVGYGRPHVVKVSAGGGAGTPTGTVTVTEGPTTIGTGSVGGTATVAWTAQAPSGTHHLSISPATGSYAATTTTLDATVTKATSTTTAKRPPRR